MLDIELRPQVQAEVGNIYFKKCAENKKKRGGEEKKSSLITILFLTLVSLIFRVV